MKLMNLEIDRIAHDTFRIKGSKVIYTDPFKVTKQDKADIVLISHDHYDHLSLDDLRKVVSAETILVASSNCKDHLKSLKVKEMRFVEPGDKCSADGVEIEAVPAYNTNKFREPGHPFHPKEWKCTGFVFQMDRTRVYFAADTDFIPEMNAIQCDIALLPVSGTYVMTPEEAAAAAAALKPKIAVPMHYAAIVGAESDARRFKSLAKGCRVEII